MDTDKIKKFLYEYSGEKVRIMEVCGSHTAAVAKNGIPSLLSPQIRLISGPGCPVCVTPTAYVDKLIELALSPDTCVVTFGDLMRVPGSGGSLRDAAGKGARVKMVYSPMDVLELAKKQPDTLFVFAAIGFETTTPVYALLLDSLISDGIKNVRLLTALKTMPEVIDRLCADGAEVEGFIAPGHVSVITGSAAFEALAQKYSLPFTVAGFDGEGLLAAIYVTVKNRGTGRVENLYKSVVTKEGNVTAQRLVNKYFKKTDAVWRGMGKIACSGLMIKEEYSAFDAGSMGLDEDVKTGGCCCDKVITGRMRPYECVLFGRVCTPDTPCGACMVSEEGSCFSCYINTR